MPKNEDGEFELVLGNKQLLSMFFVVVILLGVFFVMGYIVGRNSAPMTAAEPSRKPETKPLVVDSPAPKTGPSSEAPAASVATSTAPEKAEPPAAAPAPGTPPPAKVAETPKPPPAPKIETKAEPKPKAEPKNDAPKAVTGKQSNQAVAGATYLQLSATSKRDADGMVDELRKNGFLALDVERPDKPGTFRVLVGPIPTGEVNKTKTELQNKSFPGNAAFIQRF